DHIVVYKSERKMVLLEQHKEVKSYRISLGEQPVGAKEKEGDHRTPEGSYVLDSRNDHSRFYKAYHISYPAPSDVPRAKKLGARPGGAVMLHGLGKEFAWMGKAHTTYDWTDGCIAVTNEEIDEIWQMVPTGTPIEIKP